MSTATFNTNKGAIKVELFTDAAPETTGNFIKLVGEGFYNGLTWHRVIPEPAHSAAKAAAAQHSPLGK